MQRRRECLEFDEGELEKVRISHEEEGMDDCGDDKIAMCSRCVKRIGWMKRNTVVKDICDGRCNNECVLINNQISDCKCVEYEIVSICVLLFT